MMKYLLVCVTAAFLCAGATAGLRADTSTRHLTVATSASSRSVTPGSRVSLFVAITPKPEMHVYAPGQKDFIPVSLTLAANDAVKAETVQFPTAEKLDVAALGETHLVYTKPFRLVQDVTVAKNRSLVNRAGARGAVITVTGRLKYQACDSSICYAPVTVPVAWTLALQADGSALPRK